MHKSNYLILCKKKKILHMYTCVRTADLMISTGSKKNKPYEMMSRPKPHRPYLAFPGSKTNNYNY